MELDYNANTLEFFLMLVCNFIPAETSIRLDSTKIKLCQHIVIVLFFHKTSIFFYYWMKKGDFLNVILFYLSVFL